MTTFNIGDKAWLANYQSERVEIQCPTCFGKKEVTLILGNGTQLALPCDGCTIGYDPPTGFISDYVTEPKAVPVDILGMNIRRDSVTEYVTDKGICREDDLYSTEESALSEAARKKIEQDRLNETRVENIKKNVRQSFLWNARYHLREAKRSRENVLYHEKMARLCGNRVKEQEAKT